MERLQAPRQPRPPPPRSGAPAVHHFRVLSHVRGRVRRGESV